MRRLIDAVALDERMYHDAFEKDNGMHRWDSGLWIRYRMFAKALEEAPTVQPEVAEEQVKEAIETLEANYPDACYEQLRDAVDVALAVLKQMAGMEDDVI